MKKIASLLGLVLSIALIVVGVFQLTYYNAQALRRVEQTTRVSTGWVVLAIGCLLGVGALYAFPAAERAAVAAEPEKASNGEAASA